MAFELKSLAPDNIPPLLTEIPDPPKQLYLAGELPPFEHTWLTIVGSRAATPYGLQACREFIEGLAGLPVVIVSGLAYGIDACAHEAALRAGLPTVAIPGSGLAESVLYPRAHVRLAHSILEAGGALLSEFEPDQQAAKWTFPKRNRIMAGVSRATLVVEAKEKSGSLITARLATDYNRDLLVVPGSIFSETSYGTHQFLKLGATPVTSVADLSEALGFEAEVRVRASGDIPESHRRVLELLSEPKRKDELIALLGMPAAEASALFSTLELDGVVVEEFGMVRRAR